MFDINTCTLIPAHKTKPKHKFPLPGRRSPWKERHIQWNSGPVEVDGNFATDCSTQEPSLQTCKEFSNQIVIYAGEDDNTRGKIWCLDKWTIDTASAYIFSTKATSGHLSFKDREACEGKEQKEPFFCPYAHMCHMLSRSEPCMSVYGYSSKALLQFRQSQMMRTATDVHFCFLT